MKATGVLVSFLIAIFVMFNDGSNRTYTDGVKVHINDGWIQILDKSWKCIAAMPGSSVKYIERR
jgi:hypothetical protein